MGHHGFPKRSTDFELGNLLCGVGKVVDEMVGNKLRLTTTHNAKNREVKQPRINFENLPP